MTNKLLVLITSLILSVTASASGQYPNKPIELLVPFGPAGGSDIMGRAVARALEKELKQPIVVINKGGAGGSIGTKMIAEAPADGYTLGWAAVSNMMVAPLCMNAGYDPVTSFEPVTLFGFVPNFLAVNENFPANNYREFAQEVKNNPGRYNIGIQNCGIYHMMFEQFKLHTNLDIQMIPYKAGAQATMDAISGQVQILMDSVGPMGPHIDSGKLKPLAVASDTRVSKYPRVPTFKELGIEDAGIVSWYGIIFPANTPKHIVKKVNDAMQVALKDPDLIETFKNNDAKIKVSGPEQFSAFLRKEQKKYLKLKERVSFDDRK